jgi:hypothetical protein
MGYPARAAVTADVPDVVSWIPAPLQDTKAEQLMSGCFRLIGE